VLRFRLMVKRGHRFMSGSGIAAVQTDLWPHFIGRKSLL
jgi:hypothetical protein